MACTINVCVKIFVLFCVFKIDTVSSEYSDRLSNSEKIARNHDHLAEVAKELNSLDFEDATQWLNVNLLQKLGRELFHILEDFPTTNSSFIHIPLNDTGLRDNMHKTTPINSERTITPPTPTKTVDTDIGNGTKPGFFERIVQSLTYLSTSAMELSPTCRRNLQGMLRGINDQESWAMEILDSLGKVPPGVKLGKTKWWGEYDECIEVKVTPGKSQIQTFSTQYCTASVTVPALKFLDYTASINLGICIPNTCEEDKFGKFLGTAIAVISQGSLIPADFSCQIENLPLDAKAIVMTVICVMFLIVIAFATLYDIVMTLRNKPESKREIPTEQFEHKSLDEKLGPEITLEDPLPPKETKRSDEHQADQKEMKPMILDETSKYSTGLVEKIFLSFSAYTNGKKLLNTDQRGGSLTSINGIRFISMAWVILGHTLVMSSGVVDNIAYLAPKWVKRPSFQAIENALVSVDTFFAISGLLVCYVLMKELKKSNGPKKINWFMFYFHRLWRLTPVYMLMIGIYFCFAPYLSNGPSFNQKERPGCAKYWWANLLYINNFVYEDTAAYGCFGWSWYLATDMQFYILSPLLIIPFFFHFGFGLLTNGMFLVITWGATAGLAEKYEWPPSMYGGGPNMKNAGLMFDKYYVVPWCRMGPYLMGVVTGFLLYRTACQWRVHKGIVVSLWIVATVLACLVLYGLYDPLNGSPLNQSASTLYLTTHRTIWGACVCWVVFACATGNGGYVNTLLSWKAFIPLSRLTYVAYLVHPIIMEAYNGSLRQPIQLTDLTFMFLFVGYLVATLVISFVVSLAFESPMMGLEKAIFKKKK